MQENTKLRQNLSQTYKDKMEDREPAVATTKGRNSSQMISQPQQKDIAPEEPKVIAPPRDASCTSHNQVKTNPAAKQFNYISGQPKVNMGQFVYQ